ncbi:MAG: single-stranded DNA-binding protein [Bacteroidales bacterium]|nr:single-stranded DNA-binding protein [Bacteroidales bacterium]
MEQINKVEILGIVGGISVYTQGQTPFARVSVVTKQVYYQSASGTDVVESTWHSVVINQTRNMPDINTIRKGDAIHLVGRIKNNKYTDKDGQERYSSDIIAQAYEIMEESPAITL